MESRKNKVLMLAVRAGEIMLKSGSEIYRTEETICRICRACDIPYVQSFIAPTGIFVSLGGDGETAQISTAVKRVKALTTDLEKISQINSFVRRFVAAPAHTEESIDACLEELERIDATLGFTLPIRLLAMVMIASCYTMLTGGSVIDGTVAVGIGVVTYLFSRWVGRLDINQFIVVFASCFVAAALSFFVFSFGYSASLGAMVIGSIMVFLPGVAITNAARDLLSGDMLSGVARATESLLVTIAIAGGVGVLLQITPAPLHPDIPTKFILPLGFIFAYVGTMGIALIVNIPRRYLIAVGLIAACGWLLYDLVLTHSDSKVFSCFVATCTIAMLAEIATRISKDAATLFIIPAIYPLVPGRLMYNAMLYLIEGDSPAALATGSEALLIAGSIAVALLVMISITRVVSLLYRKLRKLEVW